MKVSESWLREWVNSSLSGTELADLLTMAGLEVDSLSPVAGAFEHVVVARVRETRPHPQADRLTLCDVDAGQDTLLRVVCGASNVRAGLLVALALPGAHLPGDIQIKESTLRGELSQGMLCSAGELGLLDSSVGILELPDDAPVGLCLREYLVLNDQVLDIDLTPNRADCLSIRGIAREVSALSRVPLQAFDTRPLTPSSDMTRAVHVHTPTACPAYAVRVIQGINPHAVTPLWMKERLRRSGVQAIHPVVDVANYVMMELGQPMHGFNLPSIQGDVHVRFARAQESITLLGGQTVSLDEKVLVIADEHEVLAMAGVMGGDASAVHADTVDVLLESAFFSPLAIAGVARRYGLSSEASVRFERGVDPALHRLALERATALLISITGGSAGPVTCVQTDVTYPATRCIAFKPARVAQLTGLLIAEDEMAVMLSGLGMTVERTPSHWMVQVPSHRFDVTLDVDLVEEIIRLYGYDKLEATPVMAPLKVGVVHPIQACTTQIAAHLSGRGYHETISYSFVDPTLQRELYPDADVMTLLNPISSELAEMRVGMWPGLIASLIHNVHRQQSVVKCFETGVVFERDGATIREHASVAGILTGEQGAMHWSEPTRCYDFFDMKGDIEALFTQLECPGLEWVAATHPALHPGQSARLFLNKTPVGWMGVLHPRLMDAFNLTQDVMVFELALAPLLNDTRVRYQRISKYPQIRRDLSLLVDESVPVAAIERVVRQVIPVAQFKGFDVFDQYLGDSLPIGKKSIAIALTLQDDNRTLVDTEINRIISAILKELDDQLSIGLRD